MARRKKDNDSHYTELIGIRFTSEQKNLLEEQAKPIPLSTYLRNLILKRSQPKLVPPINLDAYQQLQSMSTNLTQINYALTAISAQSQPFEPEEIQHWFSLISTIRKEIKQFGLSLIAANVQEATDEETDGKEFTL